MCVYMYVRMYACMYVCMYVCMHVSVNLIVIADEPKPRALGLERAVTLRHHRGPLGLKQFVSCLGVFKRWEDYLLYLYAFMLLLLRG